MLDGFGLLQVFEPLTQAGVIMQELDTPCNNVSFILVISCSYELSKE